MVGVWWFVGHEPRRGPEDRMQVGGRVCAEEGVQA